uniref:Uncharacterized protein n=1 Tax=Globodera pallida TaxID=36090 RepID=A0A183C8P8_GLOPA
MLQLMAADRKKRSNGTETVPEAPRQNNPRRRESGSPSAAAAAAGEMASAKGPGSGRERGHPVGRQFAVASRWILRMFDSGPTPVQLEWQRQRRARAMSASGASTTSGFSTGAGGIVQRHAEMRSYLQHCQRVLNARPRVDNSIPASKRMSQSSTMVPSTASSSAARRGSNYGQNGRKMRAKSVPASGKNERRRVVEDNERLLKRLLQIGLRSPPRYTSKLTKAAVGTNLPTQKNFR